MRVSFTCVAAAASAAFMSLPLCALDVSRIDWKLTPDVIMTNGVMMLDVPTNRTHGFSGAQAVLPLEGRRDLVYSLRARGKNLKFGARIRALDGHDLWFSNGCKDIGRRPGELKLHVRPWLADGTEQEVHVAIGLQDVGGRAAFDLRTLRIVDYLDLQPADDARRISYPKHVEGMPPMRGVMLPPRALNEDDERTLKEWGCKLLRFQIVRNWNDQRRNKDLDDYARWHDSMLELLATNVLPLAERRDMKVVIDLHVAPGGSNADGENNVFFDAESAKVLRECWIKTAQRFKGNGTVWAYDIINEPNQELKGGETYWTIQRKIAEDIRAIDPNATIMAESNQGCSPSAYRYMAALPMDNVIYQLHVYAPLLYTHQGIGGNVRGRAYPDAKRGIDKAWLREQLRPAREFQLRHNARMYVGEFSAVCWAPGAAEYLQDCIDIFEEYGWDWTYHAFREWAGWSVENDGEDEASLRPSADNPRRRALLDAMHR